MLGMGIGAGSLPAAVTSTGTGTPFTTYNGLALVGQGISLVRANTALVGQTAAITTTNLLTSIPGSARFRVDYYAVVSSAFTTAGLTVTIGWTDNVQAQTLVSAISGTAQGSFIQGSIFLAAVASTNITYATASTGTIGAYTVAINVEQLT